jgi:beta-lactamase class A
VATKPVFRRRFVLVVPLPARDVTLRISAIDARGRHASTIVGPVFGLPKEVAPYAGPIPALRGYEDAALARLVRSMARGFPGSCAFFVQDLRTGAGASWNARARFPAASTLKLAIAVELMRELLGVPGPGSRLSGLLWRMLVYSDDRSANELLETIGGSTTGGSVRVNTMMRALGLADSDMYGGYIIEDSLLRRAIPLEIVSRPSFIGKATTAWDLARLERALHLATGARGALIWRFRGAFTPSDARYLLYLLAHARTRGGLNAARGAGVTLLHKAGWTSKVRHDTGLLYSRRGAFVVTVLTWNGRGVGSASDLLATRIARAATARFLR